MKTRSLKDDDYFKNYAGSGKSYDSVWKDYSYAEELTELFKKKIKSEKVEKILVLGAATGKVVRLLEKGFKARCWGCEINSWAFSQIPFKYKSRIKNCDMRSYVKSAIKKKQVFNLSFSNSLIYLPKKEIPNFLRNLASVTHYVHFNSSLRGYACPDPYRKTLETYDWWNKKFKSAGFVEVKVKGARRSYLWVTKAYLKNLRVDS